ncbi:DUF945 family protein [Candidatus Venteria ishoeyi]|uniref:YdgA family protein n=1 Tax=Candidatus Venteria ishoeyi TaxID=1899563 RepID=UPI0025A547ED|nr:DUF945 family protein [Candidatus Venteria ishoeyi]MDM8545321.1 DUF945 family protein [Candidatus Venteria ishoeyi]
MSVFPRRNALMLSIALALSIPHVHAETPAATPFAPSAASEAAPAPAASEDTSAATAPAEGEMISLDYQIDKGATETASTAGENPFPMLLDILKKSIAAGQKNAEKAVKTEVHLPYPEDMIESIAGELPNLFLETSVDAQGAGSTEFSMEKLVSDIESDDAKGKINWQGLKGKIQYQADLKKPGGEVSIPGLSIDAADEFEMSMEGLALSGQLDDYLEPLKLNIELPTLNFKSEDGEFELQRLSSATDLKTGPFGLKLGTSDIKVGTLSFTAEKDETGSIHGLNIDGKAKMNGDKLVGYTLGFAISQFFLPESVDTEGLKDIRVDFQLDLLNLDAESIGKLQDTMREMQAQGMGEEMIGMAMMGQLMQAAPVFIKNSPVIAIKKLLLKTAKGAIDGNIKIALDGSKPVNLQDPNSIKMALQGDAHVSLSGELLKNILTQQMAAEMPPETPENKGKMPSAADMAQMQIDAFVQQKFLVKDGDDYTLDAKLEGGKLLVNGQEIPLPI